MLAQVGDRGIRATLLRRTVPVVVAQVDGAAEYLSRVMAHGMPRSGLRVLRQCATALGLRRAEGAGPSFLFGT